MKYYYRENIARYEELRRMGTEAWAESVYGGTDYADFSSREFLEDVIPRLRLQSDRPTALELGCGVGPGAMFLAERGFQVHGVELIEEAVIEGRRICATRGLDVTYEALDVTTLPPSGPAFDIIVDSYCLQSIVLDEDRAKVFGAVKGRLAPKGYYIVSTAMYYAPRHSPDEQTVDAATGRVFDRYDEDSLYEASTDLHYERYTKRDDVHDNPGSYEDAITVNGEVYVPLRRYRDGERLAREIESYGFDVLYQSGDVRENLVAVHKGSGVVLYA